MIFVFFFLVHVREKIIDRRLQVANQLNTKFLEHLGKVRTGVEPEQKIEILEKPNEEVRFVEISHDGDPGIPFYQLPKY